MVGELKSMADFPNIRTDMGAVKKINRRHVSQIAEYQGICNQFKDGLVDTPLSEVPKSIGKLKHLQRVVSAL